MSVSAINYGPVTVVRNQFDTMVYASTHGPGDMPLVVSAHRDTSDGDMIWLAAGRAAVAWDAAGGMPERLRSDFERLLVLDPMKLLPDNAPRQGEPTTAILEATMEGRTE